MWFSREPLGHNKLSKIVQDMCSKACVLGYRINHSLWATSAEEIFCAGTEKNGEHRGQE